MKKKQKDLHILAIAASGSGFGYAVFDGDALLNWGVKKDGKEEKCLSKAESFIALYQPDVLVLEDYRHSRRGTKAKLLIQAIIDLIPKYNVGVKLFTRAQTYEPYFAFGAGTKEALAEILAKRFPEELGPKLPPKRREWTSEDRRMAIFDAVALGLMARS